MKSFVPSKWKILAFTVLGFVLAMVALIQIGFPSDYEIESEIIPVGIFYDPDLNIQAKESFFRNMSWYGEVVNVSISVNQPRSELVAYVQTMDGDSVWHSKFTEKIEDSFIVIPGKGYVATISNPGDESLMVNYSFENAYFEDKDGNFVITRHSQYFVFLGLFVILLGIFGFAQYKMKQIGESWTWR